MNLNAVLVNRIVSFRFFVNVTFLTFITGQPLVCLGAESRKGNEFWAIEYKDETWVDACEKADVSEALGRWEKKYGQTHQSMMGLQDVDKADVPDFSNSVGAVHMLTPQGKYEFKPERFAIGGGCCLCIKLDTKFLKKLTGKDEIKTGIIGFGVKYPETATMQHLSNVAFNKRDFSKIAPKVYKTLNKNMSGKQKKALRDAYMTGVNQKRSSSIVADDVRYVAIKSKKGLVWLTWTVATAEFSSYPMSFSGAALFDDKGALINMVEPLEVRGGDAVRHWEPQYLTDLNGDGEQEVIVKITNYESGEVQLYELRDGKMINSERL